jgi:4-amino-4-deoxy-L-arabinose transferase-like glycosyltransferase
MAPRMTYSERRADFNAAGLILLYCVAYAALRLLVSPTLELDEAEQFLAAKVIALGYSDQPPLFTWILSAAAFPFGMNIVTIIAVKYSILFFFYFSFYHVARTFWDAEKSLIVTGSLLLFPTYSYEFNRNLTHTILLAAMASVTCLVYVRLVKKRTTLCYLLMGISAGLGILSKYNFVFFLCALVLASLSLRDFRKVIFDSKTLLSVVVCLVILSPHFLWLVREKFPSVREAFGKAGTGALRLDSLWHLFTFTLSSFVEAIAFPILFLVFFRRRMRKEEYAGGGIPSLFRLMALYGLLLPLVIIFAFHMGHFSGKWLAPVFFAIPLALFSSFETEGKRLKVFGSICIGAAVAIFLARAFIGFCPDITKKTERIHIPFGALSRRLTAELAEKGNVNMQQMTVVTDDSLIAANLGAEMPRTNVLLMENGCGKAPLPRKGLVIVWNAMDEGQLLPKPLDGCFPRKPLVTKVEARYLHSGKLPPFVLGVALSAGE